MSSFSFRCTIDQDGICEVSTWGASGDVPLRVLDQLESAIRYILNAPHGVAASVTVSFATPEDDDEVA